MSQDFRLGGHMARIDPWCQGFAVYFSCLYNRCCLKMPFSWRQRTVQLENIWLLISFLHLETGPQSHRYHSRQILNWFNVSVLLLWFEKVFIGQSICSQNSLTEGGIKMYIYQHINTKFNSHDSARSTYNFELEVFWGSSQMIPPAKKNITTLPSNHFH